VRRARTAGRTLFGPADTAEINCVLFSSGQAKQIVDLMVYKSSNCDCAQTQRASHE